MTRPPNISWHTRHDLFCPTCGAVGRPIKVTPGNFLIEVLLWLFFLIPGLIYSLWRISSKRKVCRYCSSASLIPVESPIALRMLTHDLQAPATPPTPPPIPSRPVPPAAIVVADPGNVLCPCQVCGKHFQFARDGFDPSNALQIPCPHCGARTPVFIPG